MVANLFRDSVFRVRGMRADETIHWRSSSLAVLNLARAIDRALASTVRGLRIALAELGDAHAADRAFARIPSELRIALTKPGDAHAADRASARNASGQLRPLTEDEEAHPADRAPTRNPSGPPATHGTSSRTRMTPVHRITHSPTAVEVELADGTT